MRTLAVIKGLRNKQKSKKKEKITKTVFLTSARHTNMLMQGYSKCNVDLKSFLLPFLRVPLYLKDLSSHTSVQENSSIDLFIKGQLIIGLGRSNTLVAE